MKKDITKIRISLNRTNRQISAQVIDDSKGVTLLSVSSREIKEEMTPAKKAYAAGQLLGKKIADKKIDELFYDRGKYRYHGCVKAMAEGLRAGGVKI